MARTIHDFETNKNAVIVQYGDIMNGNRPRWPGDKPHGCVVLYMGYMISASTRERGFRVFSNFENFSKHFDTLREAKHFARMKANKKRKLFE